VKDLTCQAFVEMVTDHLDGALDPDTQRQFVDHLPACPGCERYLGQVRDTIHALAELSAVPATDVARWPLPCRPPAILS
jgi:anti-sigma factor RsiW